MLAAAWHWWTGTGAIAEWVASDGNDEAQTPSHLASLTPFPPLPSEIRDLILMYTVPSPSYAHEARRTRLLLAYSQSDSSARQAAQAETYRHAHLSTWKHANFFLTALRTNPGMSDIVTTVRLGRFAGGTSGDDSTTHTTRHRPAIDGQLHAQHGWWGRDGIVGLVLEQCPNVTELWIAGLSALSLHELSFGQSLRQLYIVETRVSPHSAPCDPLMLPRLDTLHVWRTIFSHQSLAMLLNPITLPCLRTLHLFSIHQSLANERPPPPQVANQAHHTADVRQAATATTHAEAPDEPNSNSLAILTASLAQLTTTGRPGLAINLSPFAMTAPLLSHLALGSYATRIVSMRDLKRCTRVETLDLPLTFVLSLAWHLDQSRDQDDLDLWVRPEGRSLPTDGIGSNFESEWPPDSLIAVRVRDDGQTGFANEQPATTRDIQSALVNVVEWLDGRERTKDVIVTLPMAYSDPELHDDEDEDAPDSHNSNRITEAVEEWPSGRPQNGKLIVWKSGPWDSPDANDAGFNISTCLWRKHVRRRLCM
ncbi:hypothetical protein OIV83_005965 [Microbotryomycetes sp. JL201]|nr:hypothetical protein OIV83_005965 [Microbotryomycetes sp. JL201]